ncbi:MAG: maleylpyruvate isomerase N-terminal domain-containing protein, partial [Acidimicrobiia bacterium]|nr:maleylpyruvate isomerase N-terminal domain-containing protein [Acidimicrobiia bacterium]
MTTTTTPIDGVRPIDRSEARVLAATENERVLGLLRSLDDGEWARPTDCPGWDVRALSAHVLGGMEGFTSARQLVHTMRAGRKAAGDGPMIDGITAAQVQERAGLSRAEVLDRMAEAGPKAA